MFLSRWVHKNGELFGYNIDIMKDMAAELGVELEIKQPAFPVLIPSLENGEVDMIIMGMAITPKRAPGSGFFHSLFPYRLLPAGEQKA